MLADREMVESSSDEILAGADVDDVAFLVVGDPFGYLIGPTTLYWQDESQSHVCQGHYAYRSRAQSSRARHLNPKYSQRINHVCNRRYGTAAI